MRSVRTRSRGALLLGPTALGPHEVPLTFGNSQQTKPSSMDPWVAPWSGGDAREDTFGGCCLAPLICATQMQRNPAWLASQSLKIRRNCESALERLPAAPWVVISRVIGRVRTGMVANDVLSNSIYRELAALGPVFYSVFCFFYHGLRCEIGYI